MIKLKQQLYDRCVAYVTQRIETAQIAIQVAQASANEETKSSAGDKYETGRAMMQLEIEKNTVQLSEALKLKKVMDQIDAVKLTAIVEAGSLVITNLQNYYLAISAGQLMVNDRIYFAISLSSPIGLLLKDRKAGDSFVFNKKEIIIERIS